MMDRRSFLRRAAMVAAGVVAADQLDLLERLTHKKNWAGWRSGIAAVEPSGHSVRLEPMNETAGDNTSIWLISWGPDTTHAIFPKPTHRLRRLVA